MPRTMHPHRSATGAIPVRGPDARRTARRRPRLDTAARRRRVPNTRPRARDLGLAHALGTLLQARDLPALMDRIVHSALCGSRAREAELVLHPPYGEEQLHRVAPRRGAASPPFPYGGALPPRMVLPLGDGGERVATLRLLAPLRGRLPWLRGYLAYAGPALARLVRLRQALHQAQRYDALVMHQPDWCILVVSRDGIVRDIQGSGHFLQPRGDAWRGQPLAGQRGNDSLLGLPRARWRQILSSARRSGRAEVEARLPAATGDVEIQLTLVPLGTDGEVLCVLRDLSKVRAMEKALLRRNHELSEAAERLKEVDMLKNEFLSNVSHELRTPLTAIIAYTEAMLLTRPPEPTRDQFLQVIAEQGQKLQKLIAGLLDIAKLDSLATELKLQLGSLNQIIQAAVVTVRPTADKCRIRLHLELAPDLPLVYLDELRSQQIVWNLLTNAIKFSPPGSTVRVRTWSHAGEVWAAVSDQGIGIAPEHHQLIFQKFVQVDGSSTRRHGGVGLGLDLVQHLVTLHGGRVQVDSALGQGATFSFCIPIEKRRRPRGMRPRRERIGRAP